MFVTEPAIGRCSRPITTCVMIPGAIPEAPGEHAMRLQTLPVRTALRLLSASLTAVWILLPTAGWAAPLPEEGDGQEGTPTEEAATQAERQVPAAASQGMKVFLDPETGEMTSTPSAEQRRALSAALTRALSRSTEGLQVFDLPNGGKGVFLKGRFQHALTVRAKPDQSIETACTDHLHHAAGRLLGEEKRTNEPQDR
jgi:hypothetical protein